jgi:hypothetical protein
VNIRALPSSGQVIKNEDFFFVVNYFSVSCNVTLKLMFSLTDYRLTVTDLLIVGLFNDDFHLPRLGGDE